MTQDDSAALKMDLMNDDDDDIKGVTATVQVVAVVESKDMRDRLNAVEYANPALRVSVIKPSGYKNELTDGASFLLVECREKEAMDDLTLVRKIRAYRPLTPIVGFATFRDDGFMSAAFEAGVTDLVTTDLPADGLAAKLLALHKLSEASRLVEVQNSELVRNMQSLREANSSLKHEMAERIKADRQRLDAQEQLAESAKMASLGEMAAGIAHEIRSPLSIVTGNVSMLPDLINAEPMDKATTLGAISDIEKMTDRIEAIVRGLKAYSREGATDPYEIVPINQVIRDTIAFCTEAFEHAAIKLTIQDVPETLVIQCQPTQLSQVLLNLLTNARHAVEKLSDKWITVGIKDVGAFVEMSVTDSGPGIPPELREKIMEAFFTTKPKGVGTGLGLSISRKIVAAHGGELKIDPNTKNTRFVFQLKKEHSEPVANHKIFA